jgi:hypothetical protein
VRFPDCNLYWLTRAVLHRDVTTKVAIPAGEEIPNLRAPGLLDIAKEQDWAALSRDTAAGSASADPRRFDGIIMCECHATHDMLARYCTMN